MRRVAGVGAAGGESPLIEKMVQLLKDDHRKYSTPSQMGVYFRGNPDWEEVKKCGGLSNWLRKRTDNKVVWVDDPTRGEKGRLELGQVGPVSGRPAGQSAPRAHGAHDCSPTYFTAAPCTGAHVFLCMRAGSRRC